MVLVVRLIQVGVICMESNMKLTAKSYDHYYVAQLYDPAANKYVFREFILPIFDRSSKNKYPNNTETARWYFENRINTIDEILIDCFPSEDFKLS